MQVQIREKLEQNPSLNELVDSMIVPIVVVDDQAIIIKYNDAAIQLLGIDTKATKESSFSALTGIVLNFKDTKSHDNQHYALSNLVTKKIISLKINPVHSFSEKIFIVSLHDKTEQVQLSDQLKATQTELEFTNTNYLAFKKEIEHRKAIEHNLMEKARDLMRSNTELERFAYVVSHDLQSPLRTISSYISMLKKRYGNDLDDVGTELIDFCVDSTNNMRSLIKDLLEYSRVGTQGKPFVKTDLNTILESVRNNLRSDINTYQAALINEALPTINGDKSQLLQLFQNLIGNAIKFVSKGKKPIIEISCDSIGEEWLFSVKDNGIGIEEAQKEKIFHLFQRSESTSSYEGTGIGLAICKRIVERHGGEIWIESKVGVGSNFYFTIKK